MSSEHDSGAEASQEEAAPRIGQRQTRQRDMILQVIEKAGGPLSVPEIYRQAGDLLPSLGVATVYRTLKLLSEMQQVKPVILPSGETRYERASLGHHEHFQCRACEQVFDLSVCPVHIPRGTVLPGGFVVEDHEMTIYGLCAACAQGNGAAKKRPTLSAH